MKMKAVLSVLVLAALAGSATALFWRKYIHVNNQLTWNDAQAYCRANYVDLLTIETQEEYNNYQSNIQSQCSGGCWTGLSGNAQTLNFTRWSDGRLLTFRQWGYYKPSNMINANCVYTMQYWYNDDCTRTRTFICYTWKPDLVMVQEMKTWEEALMYCRMNYTDLVSLNTARDHFALNSMSSKFLITRFWTSLRFLDGSWFWVNLPLNTQLSFMPSCPAPSFHCGAQNANSDVLENRDCGEKMKFFCYNQNNFLGS